MMNRSVEQIMSMILRKANTFLSVYVKGAVDYKVVRHFKALPPTIFHFPVTYRCNGRCVMCNIWQQSGSPELAIEEIEEMLKDPLFQTIKYVILTGGEPTLRNDLGEIVKLLVKYCTNLRTIGLTTNGLVPIRAIMTCKEVVGACKGTNIKIVFSVSLDGLNEYHDKVRGSKKAFEKTAKTLFMLYELQKTVNFDIVTESVISKWNVENIYSLERWFKAKKIPSHFGLATYRKRNLNEKLEFMIKGQYLQKYITFLEHLRENGEWKYAYEFFWNALKYGRKRRILCPFAVEAVSVDPSGDMYYCTDSRSLGNIHDKAPYEIYYDEKNVRYRKLVQKTICPSCLQTCKIQISLIKHPLVYIKFRFINYLRRRLR